MRDLILAAIAFMAAIGAVWMTYPDPMRDVVRGTLKPTWAPIPATVYVARHTAGESVWALRERIGAGDYVCVQSHQA